MRATATLVLVLLAISMTACGSKSKPPPAHIALPGDGGTNGQGVDKTKPNTPYTFGGLVLCLDRPGHVSIDSVEPYEPWGGLAVEDFIVVPNPFEGGGGTPYMTLNGSIQKHTTPGAHQYIANSDSPKTLQYKCPPANYRPTGAHVYNKMIYVQFAKPSTATAGDRGLAINYTSDGQKFTFVAPWYVVLCGPGDQTIDCGGTKPSGS